VFASLLDLSIDFFCIRSGRGFCCGLGWRFLLSPGGNDLHQLGAVASAAKCAGIVRSWSICCWPVMRPRFKSFAALAAGIGGGMNLLLVDGSADGTDQGIDDPTIDAADPPQMERPIPPHL